MARRASLRAAGQRYQASFEGRWAHARRQERYRQKVTHQGTGEGPAAAMVRASPAAGATQAPRPTGVEVHAHVQRQLRCAFCGRPARFIRHETLARAGRPERARRFRSRGPPP